MLDQHQQRSSQEVSHSNYSQEFFLYLAETFVHITIQVRYFEGYKSLGSYFQVAID